MDKTSFIARYGNIYEHSSWVAEQAYERAAGITRPSHLAEVMSACVEAADEQTKLTLIRAHPDLAGRAAIAGELTAASSAEQASAGVDQCTEEEYTRFHALNDRYKQKFGFPFVMAVRGKHRNDILAAFEQRLANDRAEEMATAIREIHRIARLRLEALEPLEASQGVPEGGRPVRLEGRAFRKR
ncbi:MAG TPA: 2-oxo-4-hydroxy-4-carboxy-5-ureidoimidazoline decarboxylase [Woeseiaceae bacterium]|nr:2-oxo-4-hydroxy-4-carboxy-5-ureidoimidazoline decarboxylase [Woeseiaceae bacterium]